MVAKPLCPLYKNIIKHLDRARYPELRYMKYAFMPIYKSVITSQITLRQWKKLENLMEPLKIWQDWDKGKKMRKTLAKRLKVAGMSKSYVSEFTSDDELNHEILKYWKKY